MSAAPVIARADGTLDSISSKENTMRAIVHDVYGSTDVLRLAEIGKPEIADNEVLVKVHAAGLNRGTWHFMTGLPYAARLAVGLGEPVEVSSPSSSSREGGGHLDVRPLWNAPG